MPEIGTLIAKITVDTAEAEAAIARLQEKFNKLRRPWWCPPWLYRALGNK